MVGPKPLSISKSLFRCSVGRIQARGRHDPLSVRRDQLRLYLQKWLWYESNSLPWHRLAIHREFAKRGAFVRWPVHGNVLEALRERRLEIGDGTLFEPDVWITAPGDARVRIGRGCFLNLGVMVASLDLVEIGDHCMFANGCFVSDSSHRFDDPDLPITWQGFTSKGPTRIGDNCWFGAHCVVTSGVTVGDRCVIGANSVVTKDLPAGTVAAGVPAKVIKQIDFSPGSGR
jgi:acetyltransferase-like isoleucine patch superfamily enzyme